MPKSKLKKVIKPGGVSFGIPLIGPATPVDIKKTEEAWSTYTLTDGSVLTVKPVLAEVRRVTNEFNENGDPLYILSTTLVVRTTSPSKLKQKIPVKKRKA